jgi:alpha-1,2-mannosyltransferase
MVSPPVIPADGGPGDSPGIGAFFPAGRGARVALLGMVVFSIYLIFNKGVGQSQDFEVFYIAGKRILAGDFEIYKFADANMPYKYWPGFAYLMIPLAVLPVPVAQTVWALLNIGAMFAVLVLVLRGLSPAGNWWVISAWSLVLTGQALTDHFMDGQINLLIVAAMLVAFQIIGTNRSWRAFGGVMLLLAAAAVKLFPLLVFLLFVVKREWRLTAQAAVAVVLFALVPFLPVGIEAGLDQYRMWFAILADSGNHLNLAWTTNQSLFGMFLRFPISLELAGTLHKAASLLVVGLLVFGISKSPLHGIDRVFVLDFTMVACGMLLVSPLTWIHYYVFLMPFTILIVAELATRETRSSWSWIGLALLLITVVPTEMTTGREVRDWFRGMSHQVIESLLILGYAMVRQRRERSPDYS